MADKSIGTLPPVSSIDNASLFVAEQQGIASKVTGAQIAAFAKAAADANVQAAINAAEEAKEAAEAAQEASQVTAHPPQINEETGYWKTWNPQTQQYEDTAAKAEGPEGPPGDDVESIQRTSGTGAAGTTDTYTMYSSDGSEIGTFNVYNGSDGLGSGDMLKAIYDPQNRNTDIFQYIDDAIQAAILDSWGASY